MKTLIPLTNQKTKICPHCKRKLVLSIAFSVSEYDPSGYQGWCKECVNNRAKTKYKEKIDNIYENHLWGEEIDNICYCKRCDLKRKRVPSEWKLGRYYKYYFVDNEWTKIKPLCNSN